MNVTQTTQFKTGQRVICNGYPGTVIGMYSAGMVEVRFPRGSVCVPANWPDCYIATPYALRVAELEAEGCTTSDAQGIVDAEGVDDFL